MTDAVEGAISTQQRESVASVVRNAATDVPAVVPPVHPQKIAQDRDNATFRL